MSAKKEKIKHLGRGLQSLLGPINSQESAKLSISETIPPNASKKTGIKYLSVHNITPNPYQPRIQWDTTKLQELAESIKANGVIQPIIVRPVAGGYELIAGERRLRASQQAGLETIPALVREATDEQLLEIALVENIHRADLNAIERAKAYQKYIETFKLSQTQAAQKLGENRSVVANHLRILDLPEEIKDMVAQNKLSMGHARAILALPDETLKHKIANKAIAGRLSVREVEKLVRQYIQGTTTSIIPKLTTKAPHIADLEQKFKRHLGTNVAIATKRNSDRGKITIEFNSLDEFDRISQLLGIDVIAGD